MSHSISHLLQILFQHNVIYTINDAVSSRQLSKEKVNGFHWEKPKSSQKTSISFSEEDGGTPKIQESAVLSGIQCLGDFCDNKKLHYYNLQMLDTSKSMTKEISEESPSNSFECRDNWLVDAKELQCKRSHCDNIVITCRPIKIDRFRMIKDSTTIIARFSEEVTGDRNEFKDCEIGYFVKKIRCFHDNCDDLELTCVKVEQKYFFPACLPYQTITGETYTSEIIHYWEEPVGDQQSTMYKLGTQATVECANEPFWFPAINELTCTNDGWSSPGGTRLCDCKRCQNLPNTRQVLDGLATISYEQIPLTSGEVCEAQGFHPINTKAAVNCIGYPFMYGVAAEKNKDIECQSNGRWDNLPNSDTDYCECAVQCSGYCLGVGDSHKTSIGNVTIDWNDGSSSSLVWDDDCFETNNANYKVVLNRYYWSEDTQNWSKSYTVGTLNKGITRWNDNSIKLDVPDGISYIPGLRIMYRWRQETIISSYSEHLISPAEEQDQRTAVTQVPFSFDLSYLVTSPDGAADIVGVNVTITDSKTGKLLFTAITNARNILPSRKKEDPKFITVILPDWNRTSIELEVKMELKDHDILCDLPLCSTTQDFWIGTVHNMEKKSLFFTDYSIASISGSIKNGGCPVKGAGFKVRDPNSNGIINTFENATDAFGEFTIYSSLGETIIEPFLSDHKFKLDGTSNFIILIDGHINGLDFLDITTRTLTMNLLGGVSGCDASLGAGFANLQVAGGCYDEMFPVGSYATSVQVPALYFNLKVDVFSTNENYQWQWEGEKKFGNFDDYMIATKQYNNIGWHELDTTSKDYNITFRYHPVVMKNDVMVTMSSSAINIFSSCGQNIEALRATGNEIEACSESVTPDDEGNLWSFDSYTSQKIEFVVKETYGSGQECPAQGYLRATEYWSSNNTRNKLLQLDENGKTSLMFNAGQPEFSCPFTKSFFYEFIAVNSAIDALEQHDERHFINIFEAKAIVQGQALASEQSMHLTSPESIIPIMILRKPPGAKSFSSLSKSRKITLQTSMTASYGGGSTDSGKKGFGQTSIIGFGFATEQKWSNGILGEVDVTRSQTKNSQYTFTAATSQTLTSSLNPFLTGRNGDVIVGLGVTATISPSYRLIWNETTCQVFSKKAIGFESKPEDENGNFALYTYTHSYIENVIIREAIDIENNGESSTDEKAKAKKIRNEWETILNEKDRVEGIDPFGQEGSNWEEFEKFKNNTDVMWSEVKNDGLLDIISIEAIATGATVLQAMITSVNLVGASKFLEVIDSLIIQAMEMHSIKNYHVDGTIRLRKTYDEFIEEYHSFKTLTLLASEDKVTTRLSIDGGHPVSSSTAITSFNTKEISHEFQLNSKWGAWANIEITGVASESSSVLKSTLSITSSTSNSETETDLFEWTIDDPDIGDHYLIDIKQDKMFGSTIFQVLSGRSRCRHEENTVAREGIQITLAEGMPSIRNNLDPFEPAIYIIKLRHIGYDPVRLSYKVRLLRAEMTGKAGLVTFGGHSLTDFIEFRNMVKDQWIEVELVVHRSYSEYFFENLTLEAYSECDLSIHDIVSVSANWLQPCADVEIMPDVDFIPIKSTSINPYPIEIFNANHQTNPWYDIAGLEMKLVWKVWTPDDSASIQYGKKNGVDIVKTQDDFQEERSLSSRFDWYLDGLSDGKYTIAVELSCPNHSPEYSSTKDVYIQREELQVVGFPEPSEGEIYSFNENIIVHFNRELNCANPNMKLAVKLVEDNQLQVPMHLICKENFINAMPTIKTDLFAIAGKDLQISLINVMDFAGNFLNSVDGRSSNNGITWVVTAQSSENINKLPARLSMCIDEDAIIDASENQLVESKLAFKKSIYETFDHFRGIHTCRLTVSDPYYFDSTCPNGRWDLFVLPSSDLTEECYTQASEGLTNDPMVSPIEFASALGNSFSQENITLPLIDSTKPIGMSLSDTSIGTLTFLEQSNATLPLIDSTKPIGMSLSDTSIGTLTFLEQSNAKTLTTSAFFTATLFFGLPFIMCLLKIIA